MQRGKQPKSENQVLLFDFLNVGIRFSIIVPIIVKSLESILIPGSELEAIEVGKFYFKFIFISNLHELKFMLWECGCWYALILVAEFVHI